ncbi:hypothetical protein D1872_275060 [compost metagenome]
MLKLHISHVPVEPARDQTVSADEDHREQADGQGDSGQPHIAGEFLVQGFEGEMVACDEKRQKDEGSRNTQPGAVQRQIADQQPEGNGRSDLLTR